METLNLRCFHMLISVDDNLKRINFYIPRKTTLDENKKYYSELKKYRELDYTVSVFLGGKNR